jgi:hypothetical protein
LRSAKKTQIAGLRGRADALLTAIGNAKDRIKATGPRHSWLVRPSFKDPAWQLNSIEWEKLTYVELGVIAELIALAEITVRCLARGDTEAQ